MQVDDVRGFVVREFPTLSLSLSLNSLWLLSLNSHPRLLGKRPTNLDTLYSRVVYVHHAEESLSVMEFGIQWTYCECSGVVVSTSNFASFPTKLSLARLVVLWSTVDVEMERGLGNGGGWRRGGDRVRDVAVPSSCLIPVVPDRGCCDETSLGVPESLGIYEKARTGKPYDYTTGYHFTVLSFLPLLPSFDIHKCIMYQRYVNDVRADASRHHAPDGYAVDRLALRPWAFTTHALWWPYTIFHRVVVERPPSESALSIVQSDHNNMHESRRHRPVVDDPVASVEFR